VPSRFACYQRQIRYYITKASRDTVASARTDLQSTPTSMLLNSILFIKCCGTRTVSSTWTASLALSADSASWRMVPCFLLAPRLFRSDTKLHCRLSGLGTFSQFHRDPWLRSHLPGLAKNKSPRPFSANWRIRAGSDGT
jgi:hypothetical protein